MNRIVLFSIAALLISAAPNLAHAKEYSSCAKAFAFYQKDKSAQKAFATINGASPKTPNTICGGTSAYLENSRKEVLQSALKACRYYARKFHVKGKCKIVASKLK